MDSQLDIAKEPFGLSGGILLSGAKQLTVEGYCYYPLSSSAAVVNFSNLDSGSAVSATFMAGIPVFGAITAVTQSAGLAIVYYGAPDKPRY